MYRLHYEPLRLDFPTDGARRKLQEVVSLKICSCSHATTRLLVLGTELGHVLVFSATSRGTGATSVATTAEPDTNRSDNEPGARVSINVFQKKFELFQQIAASASASPISQVKISPNQQFVAVGTDDGQLLVYWLDFEDEEADSVQSVAKENGGTTQDGNAANVHGQNRPPQRRRRSAKRCVRHCDVG